MINRYYEQAQTVTYWSVSIKIPLACAVTATVDESADGISLLYIELLEAEAGLFFFFCGIVADCLPPRRR